MSMPNLFNEYKQLDSKRIDNLFDFGKHMVTTASLVLSIVIPLSQKQKSSSLLLLISLVLMLVCILFGTLLLYRISIEYNKIGNKIVDSIKKQIEENKPYGSSYSNMSTLSVSFLIVCSCSFIIGMLLLVMSFFI